MNKVNQQVPPISNQQEIKISNNLSFLKALAYGFTFVSVGILIAVGGHLLGSNKAKPQSIIPKVSVTPSVAPKQNLPVTVISPNGGEKWTVGESNIISWTADKKIKNVVISLLQGNSRSYLISPKTGVDASFGKFDWKISDSLFYVGRNDLKIVLSDAAYCSYVNENVGVDCVKDELKHGDESDNYFSIQAGGISSWKTYVNEKFGVSIKYPTDRRVSQTSNYTLPALNTNKDIVVAIQTNSLNYPRSLTGLNLSVNNDVANCLVLSNGNKVTETKSINEIAFFVFGKNLPDDAMGGIRSLNDIYNVVHDNMCYSITTSVFWRDISFTHGATDMEDPNQQELAEQQNWIQTQKQLNDQIFSTFRFTK